MVYNEKGKLKYDYEMYYTTEGSSLLDEPVYGESTM